MAADIDTPFTSEAEDLTARRPASQSRRDGGIPRDKAQRIASVIFDAIHDNVATKADVQASEAAKPEVFN
jgi:hypothetical protein